MDVSDISKILPIGFIAAVFLGPFVSRPLRLRKLFWFPAEPFDDWRANELPLEVEDRFEPPSQTLISLGFEPLGVFKSVRSGSRYSSFYHLVFQNAEQGDLAHLDISCAESDGTVTGCELNISFRRGFRDGKVIATGGPSEHASRPGAPENLLQLLNLCDVSKLLAIHLARCGRYQGDNVPLKYSADSFARIARDEFVTERDREIARGRLQRTSSPPGYRLSLKEAFKLDWRTRWPLRQLSGLVIRRRVNRELRALGFGSRREFYARVNIANEIPLQAMVEEAIS